MPLVQVIKKNKKKFLLFFCILCLIGIGIVLYAGNYVKAKEGTITVTEGDTQIVYTWDNNKIIQIKFEEDENGNLNMVITGEHKDGGVGTVYRTSGFTITKSPANKQITSYSGGKTTILEHQGLSMTSDVAGGLRYTDYIISYDALMDCLVNDLGYTASKLSAGVTVYLSNVFRVAKRNSSGVVTDKTPIYDYKNYANDGSSTEKGIVDAEYWSSTTKDYLKNYYDIAVNIKMLPNSYDIVYVDAEDESKILKTVTSNEDIVIKEKYTHAPQETIKISGTTYGYAGKYKVEYTNGKTTTNTNWPYAAGDISVKHGYACNSILKVYYEAEEEPNEYEIIASFVNEDGEKIRKDKNFGIYSAGNDFSYSTMKTPITYNEKEYSYSEKWSYSYKNSSNQTVEKKNITSPNYPSIKKLPEVKDGNAFYITLYYEEGTTDYIPDITPTPDPDEIPTPEIPEVDVPTSEVIEEPFTDVLATGMIRADQRGGELFVAELGIPTIESLFAQVTSKEYLIGYRFVKKVGVKTYAVTVSKEYILEWEGDAGDEEEAIPEILTETVKVDQVVYLDRAYGYWEIEWLDYYTLDNAIINNYALPDGSITIKPNTTYYSTPIITYIHSSEEENHIIKPSAVNDGLVLPTERLVGGKNKPTIPNIDFTYDANLLVEEIKVTSDYLSFHGSVVMSNAVTEKEAPSISGISMQCSTDTNQSAMYKNNQMIEATKTNGTYGSTGNLTYKRATSLNSKYGATIPYQIFGLNSVVIHTPVYCNGNITADNDSYVQLINPSNKVQLVLDEDHTLNDFVISVSNTGTHSQKAGYYYRDLSKTLRDPSLSYLASSGGVLRNEVRFPFDVYLDKGNDMVESNDTFIKAGTWVVIGRSAPRVYLPMWVTEGIYTVEFRSVAINGTDKLSFTEGIANTNLMNYVATDSMDVEVSGRIYGLTLYDVTDYPIWENVFRVKDSTVLKRNTDALLGTLNSNTAYSEGLVYDYTVGTQNQYGKDTNRNPKYTFPLVAGSHPYYKNIGVLKTGYGVRFKLETIGDYVNNLSYVKITPRFYYVDANGKNRISVDLYYSEEIYGKSRSLVKVGSELDQVNLKSISTGDTYLGIPKDELKNTASLQGVTYAKWSSQINSMFHFSNIRLKYSYRTFSNTNYVNKILNSTQSTDIFSTGITESKLLTRKQSYYGEYYIPATVHAVAKGYDVMTYASRYGVDFKETFWKTGGYIIVNFDIIVVDSEGNERLSYINATNYLNNGNCSMWIMEGMSPTKTDSKGVTYQFKAGDFIIYNTDKSIKDDYSVGGTH